MKIGSLFDGSGGFPLAASLCGITPTFASEVEPYPIAVTTSRFPTMRHLGDISKINGAEIEPVDIITFGSPCQDLSVAGKRAGLKHEANGDDETTRSGLFMEAVRIIKEMRRATNGEYPKLICWENVPGAFSSNAGEDFRTVLEELIKICEPQAPQIPSPGKTGWPYADCIVGDGFSLAWRLFDAQYWGVPQRRRRIYLVLDLTGDCAEEVLFEREGLLRHLAESGTPWEEVTDHAGSRSEADDTESGIVARSASESDIAATLYAAYGTKWNGNAGAYNGENFVLEAREPLAVATQQGGAEITEDGVCPTITAAAGMSGNNQPWICAYGISSYDSNAMKSDNPHAGIYEATTSRTLDLNGGYPATNQGGIVIVDQIGGQGEYYQESDVSSTLRAGGLGAIAYCYDARGNGDGKTVNTITGDHNNRITDYSSVAVMASSAANAEITTNGVSPCLLARAGTGGNQLPLVAYGTDVGFLSSDEEVSPTLLARMYKDPHLVCYEEEPQYIVRRLTPTECARLQGFPDTWGYP